MKRCSTPLIMRKCKSNPHGSVSKKYLLGCVQLFVTPWTIARQTLSVEFPRQEYWSGLPFPTPGDLLDSGIKPQVSCLAGGFFTKAPSGEWLLLKRQKYWQGCGGKRTLVHCWWQCKLVQPVLFTVFAVLFTSAKTCPSVCEWVKKMWCVYTHTHTHTHTHTMGWDGMVFTH